MMAVWRPCTDSLMQNLVKPGLAGVTAILALGVAFPGCSAPQPNRQEPTQRLPSGEGAERSYDPSKAFLTLEEIPPRLEAPPRKTGAQPDLLPQVDRALAEGRELFQQRRYTEALLALEKGLRYSPTQFELHRLLGVVCFHSGSAGRARGHLARAVELNPDDVTCHYLLGRLAGAEGDRSTEMTELRLALKCSNASGSPDGLLAHLWLAKALEAEGFLTAAVGEFENYEHLKTQATESALVEVNLSDGGMAAPAYALSRLGELYARLGRYEQALVWFSRAVESAEPGAESLQLQTRYAELAARSGRPEEALEVARRLLSKMAPTRESLSGVRAIYTAVGQPDRLIDDLTQVATQRGSDSALWSLLADALIEAQRLPEAERVLARVVESGPPTPEPYWSLADLQARAQRPADALMTLARALKAFPDRSGDAGARAESLADSPAAADAVLAACAGALSDRPDDGVLRYLLGRVSLAGGDQRAARSLLEQATQAAPTFLPSYLALGEMNLAGFLWEPTLALGRRAIESGLEAPAVYRMMARAHDGLDQIEAAAEAYQRAIEGDPQDATSILELARMWERQGEQLKARRQYQRAVAVNPELGEAYEALIRGHLNAGEAQMAAEYLERLRRHAGSTPAYGRAKALFDYVVGLRRQGADRKSLLAQYVAALKALAAEHPGDPDTESELADVLYAVGEKELAWQTLTAVLSRHADHVRARELLVRAKNRELAYEDSEAALRSLLGRFPHRGPSWWQLVQVLLVRQDWDQALRTITELVDKPFMAAWKQELQAELLNVLDLSGRCDEAVAQAVAWLEASPQDEYLRQLVSVAMLSAGRTDDLVRFAAEQYARAPGDGSLQRLLITAYAADRRYESALAQILGWMATDPENEAYHNLLFLTLREAEAHTSAIELARSMQAADENDSGMRLVQALLAHQQYDEAVQAFRSALRREPSGQMDYVSVLIQAERYKEAERILLGLAEQPFNFEARKLVLQRLAYLYQRMKDADAAEDALRKIWQERPEDVEVCNDLGYTWADGGKNLQQAEEMIRLAVAARPRTAAYLDSLGWVDYKQGDFAEARKWLRMATQARPALGNPDRGPGWVNDPMGPDPGEDPIIYDHLGDTEYMLGDRPAARQAWEQALALHARRQELRDERADDEVMAKVKDKLAALENGGEPAVAAVGPPPSTAPASVK